MAIYVLVVYTENFFSIEGPLPRIARYKVSAVFLIVTLPCLSFNNFMTHFTAKVNCLRSLMGKGTFVQHLLILMDKLKYLE